LKAYDSEGKNIGVIGCYSADEKTAIVNFMYVDRDCKISGSEDAGSNRTITYNADLKTGWNIVYGKVINDNYDVEYTTTKPAAELRWSVRWLEQEPQYGGEGFFTYFLEDVYQQTLLVNGAKQQIWSDDYSDYKVIRVKFYNNELATGMDFGIRVNKNATALTAGTYVFGQGAGTFYSFPGKGDIGGVNWYFDTGISEGSLIKVNVDGDIYGITFVLNVATDSGNWGQEDFMAGQITGDYHGYLTME
jgi:hypothetical protein